MKITKTKFAKIPAGTVFAEGESVDNATGLNMVGTNKEIYWIAVKGKGDDWAMYCGWSSGNRFIRDFGEKVHEIENVRRVLDVDDDVASKYRK